MSTQQKQFYETPTTETLEVKMENMLCLSATSLTANRSGYDSDGEEETWN